MLARSKRLSVVGLVTVGLAVGMLPSADAGGVVRRTSLVTTANCAGVGGLCQAAGNATQPGGDNPDVINATVTLIDTGTTLVGFGTGTGFRPGRTYVSLIYLNPNVATCARFPQGQQALTANTGNADNDFVSMFLGFWVVAPNGQGFFTVYPGKPTPLGNVQTGQTGLAAYGTVSVREAAGGFRNNQTQTIANNVAAGRDIPPNIFPLRSCGSLVAA